EPRPQIPKPIIGLVEYGTNLLQAIGQFNGKYIIVVALMSMIANPSCPVLPDYMPPTTVASDLELAISFIFAYVSIWIWAISFMQLQTHYDSCRRYTTRGGRLPHRPVEDLAFALDFINGGQAFRIII
ncbi:hypothetical protein M8C21_023886, partial [Ambrosia artemisiifolia]